MRLAGWVGREGEIGWMVGREGETDWMGIEKVRLAGWVGQD